MNKSESRAQHDVVIVGILTAAFALLSMKLDLSESVFAWTHTRERLQLDEFPQVLLVLAGLLCWFAWRRMRELKDELTRRRAAEAGLAAALAENRHLSRQAVDLQESERRALAREMHDELGQYLVTIRLDATAIRDEAGLAREKASDAAARIVRHVDHVQAVLRDIIGRLRPAGLDELGLAAALENCVDSWRPRLPGVDVRLIIEGELDDLAEDFSLVLYRLAQECLTNASRHAAASKIRILLTDGRDPDGTRRIAFAAEDDGRGTALPPVARGFGLAGMRERVESLGGRFAIESGPGAGFRVRATLPTVRDHLAAGVGPDAA